MIVSPAVTESFKKVEAIVREIIGPLVQADGGQVEIVEVTDSQVRLRLSGACAGCPGAPYTKSRLIEPLLHQALGEQTKIHIVLR